jgi:hypothetical protein
VAASVNEILDHLEDGIAVSVIPANADLTTQAAADMIRVSRPVLIDRIVEPDGPVPFRIVGRHRRIRFTGLDAYRRADATRRTQAADRVTLLAPRGTRGLSRKWRLGVSEASLSSGKDAQRRRSRDCVEGRRDTVPISATDH